MSQINLETKSISDIVGNFLVPSYQRGYRWEKDQIIKLLDDIYQKGVNRDSDNIYYLQPIVVKKLKDNEYELIDGQQRLTTILLIYKFTNSLYPQSGNVQFNLNYETKDISNFLDKISKDTLDYETSIDHYFISNAFNYINNWFLINKDTIDFDKVSKILANLSKFVKIIWYEIGDNENAIDLFNRLNIGKIPLTNAELVKALLFSKASNQFDTKEKTEQTELTQYEIAFQWDIVEKDLHNDEFWYFLTQDKKDNYQTRIDLILELNTEGNQNNSKDPYATFFSIAEKLSSNDSNTYINSSALWSSIYQNYLILKDWYNDHELYHKIGFLIITSAKLNELFSLYITSATKEVFLKKINKKIKETIKEISKDELSKLNYDGHSEDIKNILILFNIESLRCKNNQNLRFSFSQYKKYNWSLEHIHARNSNALTEPKQISNWLENHLKYLENQNYLNKIKTLKLNSTKDTQLENILTLYSDSNIKKLITNIHDFKKITLNKSSSKKIVDKFAQLYNEILNIIDIDPNNIDDIDNLALLDKNSNSALNNSIFATKRDLIISFDQNGAYIPYCTMMAFLKYYTNSDNNQPYFWSIEDRKNYLKQIEKTLSPYLK